VTGKLKLGGETLATIDGKWDQEISIKDKKADVRPLTATTHKESPPFLSAVLPYRFPF